MLIYLLAYSLIHLLIRLLTCLLSCIFTYLLVYLLSYLLAYSLISLIVCAAIGCPDLSPIPNSWYIRSGDSVTIKCNFTREVYQWKCKDNRWTGDHWNCSVGETLYVAPFVVLRSGFTSVYDCSASVHSEPTAIWLRMTSNKHSVKPT